MKRVLIYRSELLPASETFIASQAAALTRYSPVFAGLRRDSQGLPLDTFRVHSLTTENRLRDKLLRRSYMRIGFAPGFHRELRNLQPSLIHAHFAVDACIALTLRQQLGVPLIVTLHGYDVMRNDQAHGKTKEGRTYLARRGALLREADLFLCVSDHIRRHALERGFPDEKLIVLHIGIELPRTSCAAACEKTGHADPSVVLFVGRMVEKKGCIHLLRAMECVQRNLPAAPLVLLGDGPLRAELEHDARERMRNVSFLGIRPPCEVRGWMQRARLLAAPSIVAGDGDAEGLPTVLCEAQAMGLPIVAFSGCGVDEAVGADETALLVRQKDDEALADAILRLITDEALHQRLSTAGRERAAKLFDIRRQTALLEEYYDEVILQAGDSASQETTVSSRKRSKTSFDIRRPR